MTIQKVQIEINDAVMNRIEKAAFLRGCSIGTVIAAAMDCFDAAPDHATPSIWQTTDGVVSGVLWQTSDAASGTRRAGE